MEEEKKIEQNNNTQSEIKEAIDKELSSYINSQKTTNNQQNIPLNNKVIYEQTPKFNRPIIRTYRSDTEETIKTGHISSINMAIAENNKTLKNQQTQTIDPEEKKIRINKTFVIITIIFIVGGALTIGIPYFIVKNQDTQTKVVEKDISKSIITPDLVEKININDLNLNRVSTTLKERVDQSSIKLGQVKNIYLTDGQGSSEQIITSTKFLNLIKANIPDDIKRTIKESYMFGMHNYDGNQRFLILKTGSYDLTFSGMLSWENDLWQDFKEIFSLESKDDIQDQNSSSTAIGIEVKKFQDAIFNNKDCRVVKNSSGEIIFLYSIIDKNTVVITTNTNTLREIINRVNRANVTQ